MADISGAPALSRRTLLTLLAGAGTATLVGCDPGGPTGGAQLTALPDPLLVEVDGGLGLLRGVEQQLIPRAAAAMDGLAIFATEPVGADTALWRIDTMTRTASTRVLLPGRWLPQAVSPGGTKVALTQTEVDVTEGRPGGRDVTPVLIADATGAQSSLELRGNFVPETFTDDHSGLFVLEWLPAKAPEHYRVRVVDLATKTAQPLLTRNKVPLEPGTEEEMRGDGRQAVLAPDLAVLYTLYTHQPDHAHSRDLISGRPGNAHAFVHTLNLPGRWAFCIDLPHPFGESAPSGHAMAITPDGQKLYVADVASGGFAEIFAEDLTVRRTVGHAKATGTAYAAADSSRVFLGAGDAVRVIDRSTLGVTTEWRLADAVTGLVVSPDAKRLYIGQSNAITWYDIATGTQQGRTPVVGLTDLKGLAGRA